MAEPRGHLRSGYHSSRLQYPPLIQLHYGQGTFANRLSGIRHELFQSSCCDGCLVSFQNPKFCARLSQPQAEITETSLVFRFSLVVFAYVFISQELLFSDLRCSSRPRHYILNCRSVLQVPVALAWILDLGALAAYSKDMLLQTLFIAITISVLSGSLNYFCLRRSLSAARPLVRFSELGQNSFSHP